MTIGIVFSVLLTTRRGEVKWWVRRRGGVVPGPPRLGQRGGPGLPRFAAPASTAVAAHRRKDVPRPHAPNVSFLHVRPGPADAPGGVPGPGPPGRRLNPP